MVTLLDEVVFSAVAFYHLEKSGDHNDIEARVCKVLKYVPSCGEFLKAS